MNPAPHSAGSRGLLGESSPQAGPGEDIGLSPARCGGEPVEPGPGAGECMFVQQWAVGLELGGLS